MEIEGALLKKPLFGENIGIVLHNVDETFGQEILDDAYDLALKLQKIFSFYDKESELSILNKKRNMAVSHDLMHVVKKALELCKLTEGKYDISLGKNILERKKGKNLSKLGCSYKNIKISGRTISLQHPDAMIDLGSIAKGYITDKIAEFLKNQGVENFMIDSRGDLVFYGDYFHILEIQHPREKNKSICKLMLNNICIATSGDYKQYKETVQNSHILNQKEVISITVTAPTLEEADAYSTALFVCDEKEREKLLKDKKEIKALTIDNKLNLKTYNDFNELFYKESADKIISEKNEI